MIQITLTFSSITQAVAALREIPENALIQAPRIDVQAADTGKPKAEKTAKVEVKAEVKPEPEVKASEPAAPAADTSAAEPKEDAPAAEDKTPLDYAVLQKAVFALATKSKEAALAVNSSFGVKTMKDLPEGDRRRALAAVNAKIAELEVA